MLFNTDTLIETSRTDKTRPYVLVSKLHRSDSREPTATMAWCRIATSGAVGGGTAENKPIHTARLLLHSSARNSTRDAPKLNTSHLYRSLIDKLTKKFNLKPTFALAKDIREPGYKGISLAAVLLKTHVRKANGAVLTAQCFELTIAWQAALTYLGIGWSHEEGHRT